jgi:hypothetical protein
MSLRESLRRLWRLIAPRSSGDIEEELRSHQHAYQEELIRQGLTAEEAQRKARIDLGQPATQNETYRAAVGLRLFDELTPKSLPSTLAASLVAKTNRSASIP